MIAGFRIGEVGGGTRGRWEMYKKGNKKEGILCIDHDYRHHSRQSFTQKIETSPLKTLWFILSYTTLNAIRIQLLISVCSSQVFDFFCSHFEDEQFYRAVIKLWEYRCPASGCTLPPFPNFESLKKHLKRDHKLMYWYKVSELSLPFNPQHELSPSNCSP